MENKCYSILKFRTRVILYRNFFRKVFFISHSIDSKMNNSLEVIASMFNLFIDPEIGLDDVESIIASIMDQGYIRGYILHSRQLVVFAKNDPFPTPYQQSLARRG